MRNFAKKITTVLTLIFVFGITVVSGVVTAYAQTTPGSTYPVQAAVTLYPNEALVTINKIQPAISGPVTISLIGGVQPNLLTLFGGTIMLPSGQDLPKTISFPINPALTGQTYFGRLYIDGGSTNIVFPGATQSSLILTVTPSANANENTLPSAEETLLPAVEETGEPALSGAATGFSAPAGGLVPCGNPGQAACTFNDVVAVISNLINYIFVAIVPVATVMFIIIGTQYMLSGGNVELKSVMKQRLSNLIFGIVIILGAWLLVATILRVLGVDDAYILLDL